LVLSGNNSFGALGTGSADDNTNKIPSTGTGSLTLNACALTVQGNNAAPTTAAMPNFVASVGQNAATVISGTNQNATLVLNGCSRVRGGSVDFSLANTGTGVAAITTTNGAPHNSLLRDGVNARSGYATFNGGVSTLTIDTTRTLTLGAGIGGILMTPDATGKATVASAGTGRLTVGDSNDLSVHQYNTLYDLELSTAISYLNNASLTKVGPGLLYMNNGANTTVRNCTFTHVADAVVAFPALRFGGCFPPIYLYGEKASVHQSVLHGGGHHGSHPHLVNEFVQSIVG
jgi:hypothetical protein